MANLATLLTAAALISLALIIGFAERFVFDVHVDYRLEDMAELAAWIITATIFVRLAWEMLRLVRMPRWWLMLGTVALPVLAVSLVTWPPPEWIRMCIPEDTQCTSGELPGPHRYFGWPGESWSVYLRPIWRLAILGGLAVLAFMASVAVLSRANNSLERSRDR